MRFNSEIDRMRHPQASLIPSSYWNEPSLFNCELPDNLLPVMQVMAVDINNQIKKNLARLCFKREKQIAWLAIVLSHPDLSALELINIGRALKINDDGLFILAAQYGQLDVLCILEESAQDLHVLIASDKYEAFCYAARFGRLEIMRHLEEKAPELLLDMIRADGYEAFCYAARNGHFEVMRYLEEKAQDLKEKSQELDGPTLDLFQDMISAVDYRAFQSAAKQGRLEVLHYLEEKVSVDVLQKMIAAGNYGVFRYAAQDGQLDVLRYIEEKAPGLLQNMMAANQCEAFRAAAQNGHLNVLHYLEEKAQDLKEKSQDLDGPTLDLFQDMISVDNYRAFCSAVEKSHTSVICYLLSRPSCFAYAEEHEWEYGYYIHNFVSEKLNALHAQKEAAEAEHPNVVFDIASPTEARLLLYMAKNLIRRNDLACRDDLLFLLNIPAVKALAHIEVTERMPNALIRLALSIGNQPAIELLLNIPAVRRLAEQNNFYRREISRGIDLSVLAQNSESSMTALSQGEQARLQEAVNRYQPMIKARGIASIMEELRKTLEYRYAANPATIMNRLDEPLILPLQWSAFQQLGLRGQELTAAIAAYAQNKDHTAWRYLLKPNPWMHEHASYVEVNPQNYREKWSTFQEYQPEICMFYLGAIDKETSPIDGYTLESRLDGFIDELAHIGRAHNWDDSRMRMSATGELVLDDNGDPIDEEYDNLEKDRPSCFSGVKRRLFQSVKGHPLFVVLTQEIIDGELRDFVRQHFEASINEGNRQQVKGAWDKIIQGDELTDDDWSALKSLDMSAEQQDAFRVFLRNKYGSQFTLEPGFTKEINAAFAFKKELDAHVLNFGQIHPEDFWEQSAPVVPLVASLGLFNGGSASASEGLPVPTISMNVSQRNSG